MHDALAWVIIAHQSGLLTSVSILLRAISMIWPKRSSKVRIERIVVGEAETNLLGFYRRHVSWQEKRSTRR
jgi:hypothetical protein